MQQEGREENLADLAWIQEEERGFKVPLVRVPKAASRVARGWPATGWGAAPKEAAATKRGRQAAMRRGGGGDGGEEEARA